MLTANQTAALQEARSLFDNFGQTAEPPDTLMRVKARTVFHLVQAVEHLLAHTKPRSRDARKPTAKALSQAMQAARVADAEEDDGDPLPRWDIPPALAQRFTAAYLGYMEGEVAFATVEEILGAVRKAVGLVDALAVS